MATFTTAPTLNFPLVPAISTPRVSPAPLFLGGTSLVHAPSPTPEEKLAPVLNTPSDIILDMWTFGKSQSTQNLYKRVGNRFLIFVGKYLSKIDLRDCQDFITSLGHLSESTQKTYIAVIKSLLRFTHKLGITKVDVGQLLKTPKIRDCINERIISKQQIKEIINGEGNRRNKLILKSLYILGLRASEIGSMKWSDIVLQPNEQGILSIYGKGDKTRFLIIPKSLLRELLQLKKDDCPFVFTSRKKHGCLDRTQVFRIVKSAGERVGIDAPSPHWFRHSHATHALESKTDIHLLSKSLGHSSISTTSRYLHASPDDCSSLYVDI